MYYKKLRGIVTADGQDVAVAFVFVFVFVSIVIDIVYHHCYHRRVPICLVVITERTVLHYCADSITILLSASPYVCVIRSCDTFCVIVVEKKKRNKQTYISI